MDIATWQGGSVLKGIGWTVASWGVDMAAASTWRCDGHYHVDRDAFCGTLMGGGHSLGNFNGGGSSCHKGTRCANEQGRTGEANQWCWRGVGSSATDSINNGGSPNHNNDNYSCSGSGCDGDCSEATLAWCVIQTGWPGIIDCGCCWCWRAKKWLGSTFGSVTGGSGLGALGGAAMIQASWSKASKEAVGGGLPPQPQPAVSTAGASSTDNWMEWELLTINDI